tara:strand:- start:103 stop:1830 length:1728 start_codon:yes stop_codon:yes gene_type:complete
MAIKDLPEGVTLNNVETPNLGVKDLSYASLMQPLMPPAPLPEGVTINEKPIELEFNVAGVNLIPDWVEQVARDWDGRDKEVSQTLQDYKEGEMGEFQKNTQLLGKGVAGKGVDLIGGAIWAGAETIGSGISLIIPDEIEEDVFNSMKAGADFLLNTNQGRQAAESIEQGVGAYEDWKEKNPQYAKTLESLLNIGSLFAPAKVKVKSKPVPTYKQKVLGKKRYDTFKRAGTGLERRNIIKQRNKEMDNLSELVLPQVSSEDVARGFNISSIGNVTLNRSDYDKGILDEVRKAGVKTSKNEWENADILIKTGDNLGDQLQAVLAKNRDVITPKTLNEALDNASASVANNVFNATDDAVQKQIALLTTKAKEIFNDRSKYDSTALGVLGARKEFDNFVRDQLGSKGFNASDVSVANETMKAIRNAGNDLINNAVPNDFVKRSLIKQSRLYSARDVLFPKAAKRAKTVVGRQIQNVSKILALNMEARRTMALATGLAISALPAQLMMYAAGGLAVGGVGFYTIKGALSPQARIALGKLLKLSDKALKEATRGDMKRDLKLGIIAINDMLELPSEKEQEQ